MGCCTVPNHIDLRTVIYKELGLSIVPDSLIRELYKRDTQTAPIIVEVRPYPFARFNATRLPCDRALSDRFLEATLRARRENPHFGVKQLLTRLQALHQWCVQFARQHFRAEHTKLALEFLPKINSLVVAQLEWEQPVCWL